MKHLAALALAAALAAPPALAQESSGKTELTWYGHAAFTVRTPKGFVLAIDPWLSNPADPVKDAAAKLGKVDAVLVTHGHSDHVGDAVAIGRRTHAKLVASFELARQLALAGYPEEQAGMATSGNMGGTIVLSDEVSVTIVPAVHSSGFSPDGKSAAVYGGNPVGFVIRVKGGPTLYHTGDTDVFGDMKLVGARWPVDVMLACIGGHFTMDPEGAATAAGLVGAKAIVPMHFGTFPILEGTPAALEKAIAAQGGQTKVLVMKPGETRRL
ncbi:metal-dependent hydrolase [Anaeromyxobacter paludicola]|uniref:UPF0173 metal-dependent hydrolase AMPC_14680 n=1 Tax=Anaeromyxobacter paludicola TaxID=2918171 RepID=A0ABM7X931_9BACT|nr:metal-dependent hydrolase [Anaeromyxobacter paludicola]BDG08355.1 UPF0173 metal-dependent hydrolase [Anaeromyxobacter paludicola]